MRLSGPGMNGSLRMLDGEFILGSPHVFAVAELAMNFASIYVHFEKVLEENRYRITGQNISLGLQLPLFYYLPGGRRHQT